MTVISKQFELIEMSNTKYVFKHFLNIGNVPDARMFTGNSFHSPILYQIKRFAQSCLQFVEAQIALLSPTILICSKILLINKR